MPDPIRLLVHKKLTTLLEGVNPDDIPGCPYDLRGSVKRGRNVFGRETKVPFVAILESPIPSDPLPAPPDATVGQGNWQLVIQGFAPDDLDNPTDPAHLLMAPVKMVLALEKKKAVRMRRPEDGILGLGNNVTGLYIGGGVVRPADELSRTAYFWLTLGLDFNEDMADPYGTS